MTKCVAVKPRYYKSKGKTGCRVYLGRKYLGYSASKEATNDAVCKPKPPVERMHESEKMPVQKEYKYVISRQTKKGPMYQGAILGPEEDQETDTVDQEILPSGQVPEGGSYTGSRILGDDTREHQSEEVFAGVASAIR